MADSRQFTLIASFTDNVSPALEKINNSIDSLKRNLGSFGAKKGGFNDLTKSMGKVISAHKILSEEVRTLRGELTKSIPVLREYRKEVGKTVGANMMLQGKGKKQKFSKSTNPTLQFLDEATRRTRDLAQASRGVRLGGRIPRGGGGGGGGGGYNGGGGNGPRTPGIPRIPRSPGGGGGGGGNRPTSTFGTNKFGVSRDAEFAFGQTLGFTIGSTVTGAIVQGFQIGVGLMTKPFEYFAGAFGERIKDELDDLKAAGGLYSISKRSENPFLKNIDEAIQYQQETNKTFAKMAAALPGVTNDYVQVGKRLSDTAARIVTTDFEKARTEANRIRSTEEGRKFYGGAITGTGAEQQRQTITTLLGELTKKTTIAGLGGRSGAGGIAGAYGLPGLTERMISQEQVSMGQFQRYAAVFSDPAIADALKRNVDKLNATKADSMDRFQAMQKLLDEIVTPDLVEKLRTSVDGVYQGLRSAILDPDTGLFGLGRNFEKFGKRINQYGEYVNEAGVAVKNLNEAANEDLSIFEILRDIFSNAGQALSPIVEALPLIFDPLKKIGASLMDARHYAAEFNRTFNQYREGLKALSETSGMDFIKDTLDIRASLSAINNLLLQLEIIGKGEFDQIAAKLTSKDLNIGEILSGLLDKVLNSKIAYNIGETVGNVVGTVLSETSKMVAFFAGLTDDSSQLAEGLKKGFYAAGGPEAFRSILQNVFKALIKGIVEIFKAAPLEISILGSIALLLPAFAAAFSIRFANLIEGWIDSGKTSLFKQMEGLPKSFRAGFAANMARSRPVLGGLGAGLKPNTRTGEMGGAGFRPLGLPPKGFEHIALPGSAPPVVRGVTAPSKAPAIPKPVAALKKTPFGALSKIRAKGVSAMAAAMITLSTEAPGLAKGAGAVNKFFESFLGSAGEGIKGLKGKGGILALGVGIVEALMSLFKGESLGTALGKGAGPVLGSIIGAALLGPLGLGPLGAFIGGWVGSMEAVTKPLGEAFSAIGGTLGPIMESLGASFQSIVNIVGSLVMGLVGAFLPLEGQINDTTAMIIAIKIALTPIVAAFQLIEQVVNLLAIGLKGLELAVLYARRGLAQLNPFGDEEKKKRLDQEIYLREQELNQANGRVVSAYNRHKKWYETDTTTKPIPDSSVPSAKPDRRVSGLTPTTADMAWYKSQMKNPIPSSSVPSAKPDKRVSGLTPTAADMAWYKSQMPAAKGAGGATIKPLTPANNIVPQSIQKTAQNTTLQNQKATTQIRETAAVKTGTDKTTAAVKDLTAKITSQSSLQTSVAAIYNLMASGMLRVQTNMTGMMMPGTGGRPGPTPITGVGTPYIPGVEKIVWEAKGGLGNAVASEMKNKPLGSDLVIANSSETVIPAAGGYGMKDFMGYLRSGFDRMATIIPLAVKMGIVESSSYGGSGGNTFGNINVTVNAGATTDPDALASIVALKIGEAVADARASSVFV